MSSPVNRTYHKVVFIIPVLQMRKVRRRFLNLPLGEFGVEKPHESIACSFPPGNSQSWDVTRSWIVLEDKVPWEDRWDPLNKGQTHKVLQISESQCQTPLGVTVWYCIVQYNHLSTGRDHLLYSFTQKQEVILFFYKW